MFKRLFGKTATPMPPRDDRSSPHPGEVTDATFAVKVLSVSGLVAVDFWADWCAPCEVMSAFVEFLARDFADTLTVYALDADENPISADRFTVMSLPTLIFFQDGNEIHRTVGVSTYDDLKRQVSRLTAIQPDIEAQSYEEKQQQEKLTP